MTKKRSTELSISHRFRALLDGGRVPVTTRGAELLLKNQGKSLDGARDSHSAGMGGDQEGVHSLQRDELPRRRRKTTQRWSRGTRASGVGTEDPIAPDAVEQVFGEESAQSLACGFDSPQKRASCGRLLRSTM